MPQTNYLEPCLDVAIPERDGLALGPSVGAAVRYADLIALARRMAFDLENCTDPHGNPNPISDVITKLADALEGKC